MKKLIAKTAIPQAERRLTWQMDHTQSLLMILFLIGYLFAETLCAKAAIT